MNPPLAGALSPLGRTRGAGLDADALAFLTAAAISDGTQSAAINTLVAALKSASLWTKLKAIYPFVGASAASHKWNLKDPRDLDAAFRLVFSGGWTHQATGILPNGSSYADTKFDPSAQMTVSNGSLGFYCRTQSDGATGPNYDMGCASANDARATIAIIRYWNNSRYANFGSAIYQPNKSGITDGRGFIATNRLSSTVTEGYFNGAQDMVAGESTVIHPTYSIYIGGCNKAGTFQYPSTKEYAFAFMGEGLTSGQHAALYAAVQAFQTALGRSV